MSVIAQTNIAQEAEQTLASVILNGDLSRLSPKEKVVYYNNFCQSLGLNPLTKPFEYMRLNGKETLYAKKDATEQLRKVNGISIEIKSREIIDDIYIVTASAKNSLGRTDESIGAVSIAGLKGEAKANAIMKAETKSKRRVTLSISGLGLLDENEVETIPNARIMPEESLSIIYEVKDSAHDPINSKELEILKEMIKESNTDEMDICNYLKIESIGEMRQSQLPAIMRMLNKKLDKMNKEETNE